MLKSTTCIPNNVKLLHIEKMALLIAIALTKMKNLKSQVLLLYLCLAGISEVSSQVPGSNIFDAAYINEVRIYMSQENYWDSLLYYKEEGDVDRDYTFMVCSIEFNGVGIDSVGIRLKGNSSFGGPSIKKSIKLKFNKYVSGQKLDGLKKVNLNNNFNDPTLMREKLFLDVLQETGVYAPRCCYAKVFINDGYWGLYTLVDHIDKVFLLSNFNSKSGNLYKGDRFPWEPCANLAYHDDPLEYRNCYSKETNEEVNDWSDLEDLITKVNHTPIEDYYLTISSVLNTASFMNAWASNIVFVNVDSYVETGHNYYTYHNPVSGKFEWITWDVNEAFGLWNVRMPLDQLYNLDIFYLPDNPHLNRPLTYYMLEEPNFRKIYLDKVYELVLKVFNPDILFPRIDSLYALIKTDVHMDPNKIIGNDLFERNINDDVYIEDYPRWVPGLKSFIRERHQFLQTQLQELGYSFTVNQELTAINQHLLSVIPNPTFDHITLETHFKAGQKYTLELRSITGQLMLHKNIDNPREIVDLSPFPNGVYILRITDHQQVWQKKILKL